MNYHRFNRKEAVVPEIGETVLLVGEERNRGLSIKGKVLQHVTGEMVLFEEQLYCTREIVWRGLCRCCALWKSEVRCLQKHQQCKGKKRFVQEGEELLQEMQRQKLN